MTFLRLLQTVLLGLLLAIAVCVPASAEKRVALVIRNGAYAVARRLSDPVNDARDIAPALATLGFHVVVATAP